MTGHEIVRKMALVDAGPIDQLTTALRERDSALLADVAYLLRFLSVIADEFPATIVQHPGMQTLKDTLNFAGCRTAYDGDWVRMYLMTLSRCSIHWRSDKASGGFAILGWVSLDRHDNDAPIELSVSWRMADLSEVLDGAIWEVNIDSPEVPA